MENDKFRKRPGSQFQFVWKEPLRFSGHGSVDVIPSGGPHAVSQALLSDLSPLTAGSGESRPAHEHSGTFRRWADATFRQPRDAQGSFWKGPFWPGV